MRFDEHFLEVALSEFSLIEAQFPGDVAFAVDSRTIQTGDIFVAIEGSRFDGHNAIEDVLKRGASGVFLKQSKKQMLNAIDKKYLKNKLIVAVNDTQEALIKMATLWRSQFDYPVVAITGSVGKTSTKEMVSNILRVTNTEHIASFGNQNTKIGVSINVFKMREYHKVAIFEFGISRRGDMPCLVDIVKPTTALITGVGHSHMEGLGSLADIAAEKRKVFSHFNNEYIGIINGDQPILSEVGYGHPVIRFGSKTTNQIQARKISFSEGKIHFVIKIYRKKYTVILDSTHTGAVFNALAAAAIGHLLGVSDEKIIEGIQIPITFKDRFEKRDITKGRGVLISDCYNASPESMKAALVALEHIDTKAKKIAVLGDMLELGVNSPFWHRQLGRVLRKTPSLKKVVLVGDLVSWTKKTLPIGVESVQVKDWKEAVTTLEQMVSPKSSKKTLVLVKGSLGMNLSQLVKHFTD